MFRFLESTDYDVFSEASTRRALRLFVDLVAIVATANTVVAWLKPRLARRRRSAT